MADTIIIICGPSGVGKTTLKDKLEKEFGEALEYSVSFTTRDIRKGEKAGKDYKYVSKEEFQQKKFYETCQFSGNFYGTSKDEIKRIQENGKIPLLDVNVRSVKQLQQQKELKHLLIIFIKPPNPVLETLEQRLRKRAKETGENEIDIKKRLSSALTELQECENLNLENIIINDDVDKAYNQLCEIVIPLIQKLQGKNDDTVSQNENINTLKDNVLKDKSSSSNNNQELHTVADEKHVSDVNNDVVSMKIDNIPDTGNGNRITLETLDDAIRGLCNGEDLDTVIDNDGLDVDLDNKSNRRYCIIL